VMQTPSLVHSQVHMPMVRLHWQTQMPFIVQQQLHMPSHSILHKFCSVPQETSSSQMQRIFIPPWHFSIFIVQRGTMHQLPVAGEAGAGAPKALVPNPVAPIGARSRIALLIAKVLSLQSRTPWPFECRPCMRKRSVLKPAVRPLSPAFLWLNPVSHAAMEQKLSASHPCDGSATNQVSAQEYKEWAVRIAIALGVNLAP